MTTLRSVGGFPGASSAVDRTGPQKATPAFAAKIAAAKQAGLKPASEANSKLFYANLGEKEYLIVELPRPDGSNGSSERAFIQLPATQETATSCFIQKQTGIGRFVFGPVAL